jgi:hypothetical protein
VWVLVEEEDFDRVLALFAYHPDNNAQVRLANRPTLLGMGKLAASNAFVVLLIIRSKGGASLAPKPPARSP